MVCPLSYVLSTQRDHCVNIKQYAELVYHLHLYKYVYLMKSYSTLSRVGCFFTNEGNTINETNTKTTSNTTDVSATTSTTFNTSIIIGEETSSSTITTTDHLRHPLPLLLMVMLSLSHQHIRRGLHVLLQ